tara:strand:- start:415 stop:630 length:216 start_codon:yes stop_codon:yes gene_type:complete
MSVENNSFYHIQDIIDKEFRDAFRVRMTEEEEAEYWKKHVEECNEKMIEISDACKTYLKKQFESPLTGADF